MVRDVSIQAAAEKYSCDVIAQSIFKYGAKFASNTAQNILQQKIDLLEDESLRGLKGGTERRFAINVLKEIINR